MMFTNMDDPLGCRVVVIDGSDSWSVHSAVCPCLRSTCKVNLLCLDLLERKDAQHIILSYSNFKRTLERSLKHE